MVPKYPDFQVACKNLANLAPAGGLVRPSVCGGNQYCKRPGAFGAIQPIRPRGSQKAPAVHHRANRFSRSVAPQLGRAIPIGNGVQTQLVVA
eukprot:9470464-Pyramimonas_sp.AAC.1